MKDPLSLEQLNVVLKQAEIMIEWAVGTVYGKSFAETVKSGKGTDSSLLVDKRLLDRITRFLATKISRSSYSSLVREFAGEDSVQGDTVYMDPGEETEAFSQWLIFDIKLPGESQRLIDLFAKTELAKLPSDEQGLLKVRLADRPSIYKVVKMGSAPKEQGTYLVQDLLSPDCVIRIQDKSTSLSLQRGSIFMGRAIPVVSSDSLFGVMGSIAEYPAKLWNFLSGPVDNWSKEYYKANPNSGSQDFFRSHHARLRGEIRNIVVRHARY